MRWDLFWVHKVFFGSTEADVGFSVFSATHLLWLGLMALFIAAFAARYRRSDEKGRDNLRKGMALFLILFEIVKQCVVGLTGAPAMETMPLEICSFAEYTILADAYWPKNRFFGKILITTFLPAAIMALAFPTVTAYPPINFYTIHQFVLHAGIAAYIFARYAAGEFRPRYADLWISLLAVSLAAALIYLIDLKFNGNFMFLTGHADNPVLLLLWNLAGGNGGLAYVAALVAFVALVLHVVFGIYSLIELARRK